MNVSLTFKNSYVPYGGNNLRERQDGSRNKVKATLLCLSKYNMGVSI
jgi:hypothetical protein